MPNENDDGLAPVQFAEADRMIDEAARAMESNDLATAANRLAEALTSAISEATQTIDRLKARIVELESAAARSLSKKP